ncbi:MAG: toll/interleukin-1 receptor domain-containing protein [Gammaproteobacteria bacterium]|jgi:hypothetical protein
MSNSLVYGYFQADMKNYLSYSDTFNISECHPITKKEIASCSLTRRVHMDFVSNAIFFSYYIPDHNLKESHVCDFLTNIETALSVKEKIQIAAGLPYERSINFHEMPFTNLIYVYTEKEFTTSALNYLSEEEKRKNVIIKIRGMNYAHKRQEFDHKPMAFLSHDSRDKEEIAKPLCHRLMQRMCNVWYDEYSLKVGDSLRENIDKGLKECKKCILVLSPNFIQNRGWTKTEFESIFHREIMEKKNLIIPIWHNISKEEVYNYCPSLVDRIAICSSEGLEAMENKIYNILLSS